MTDLSKWKSALSPNYESNVDKLYPYSEMPYDRDYKVVKIPFCTEDLIEHVNYFGEGKGEMTVGFNNCYNVHYQFYLVSSGQDKGRKIPNRIPISPDDVNEGTRKYIKDNSVRTVTVALARDHMSKAIAQDIARIANGREGKVIIYDYTHEESEIITEELKIAKQLFYCPIWIIPDNLALNYCNTSYKAYLSGNEIKRELYRNIVKDDIEAAVILTTCLNNPYASNAIRDVVNKLIANKIASVIVYAYKLWNNNFRDVVLKHFPQVFQEIFNGDCMVIVNKLHNQELLLEPSSKLALCGNQYKSTKKMGWRLIPEWNDNNVNLIFKLYNVDSKMFLKLCSGGGDGVEEKAHGSEDSKDQNVKFNLVPLMMNRQVAFTIHSYEHGKRLELPADMDSSLNKPVLGQKADASENDDRSRWILAASNDINCEDYDSDFSCRDDSSGYCNQ
nr:low molecular mass lipoprotein 4 [Helicoverpa armigera]